MKSAKPFSPQQRSKSKGAFTLVEVFVAMGITALLVTFMVGTVTQVLGVWDRTSGSLSARAQADLIFGQLTRDLEAVVFRRDGGVWFAVTVQPSPQMGLGDAAMSDAVWGSRVKPGNENPGAAGSSLSLSPPSGSFEDYRFGQAGVWLRFISTPPDSQTSLSNLSAPRAVAYQLVRRHITASASAAAPANAPIRYALYRSTARPMSPKWPDVDSTFSVGYDLFAEPADIGFNRADSSQIDQVGNIRGPRRYEQIIGNNVIDFGVRCWVRDSTGKLSLRFPAVSGFPSGNQSLGFASTTQDGGWLAKASPPGSSSALRTNQEDFTFGFPERVDVFVRILTEEGARLIEAFEAGFSTKPESVSDNDTYWWELALSHSRVFTQQVTVHARGF